MLISYISPVQFTVTRMALIWQWPGGGHYEWEVVKTFLLVDLCPRFLGHHRHVR